MFGHDAQHTGRSPYVGPAAPALRWRFLTSAAIESSPAIGTDGTIYVGSCDGSVYALYSDGRLRWSYRTGGAVHSSPAIAVDGTVYVGSLDGCVYALWPDGRLRWRYSVGAAVRSSPAIAPDGTLYVGANDGYLYALNPDGGFKWRFCTLVLPPYPEVYSSPAIAPDGTVYIDAGRVYLFAVRPDGSEGWRCLLASRWGYSSPAVAAGGVIWVGSDAGCLHAVQPDGEFLVSCAGNIPYPAYVRSSPAIDASGLVYIGVDSSQAGPPFGPGYLLAVDPRGPDPNEWTQWTYSTGDVVESSPAIDGHGTIFVGCNDGYLYAVRPDGTLAWRYATGGAVKSSPAIGVDGTVYVGSSDGYLYAVGEAPPVPTPTPAEIEVTVTLQYGADGYTGAEDTYLHQYAADTNYCTQDLLRVGYKQQYAPLLRFDLSSIPASATVQQATLQVYARGWGGSDMTINAYRVARDVSLCQATWNRARSREDWGLPGCNDATTDRAATPESSVSTSGISRWYSLDLTDAVQSWINAGASNNGVLLRGAASRSTSLFHLASAQSSDARLRPRLVITFRAVVTPVPTPPATPPAAPSPTPGPSITPAAVVTVTLQNGLDGYRGSQDTHLYQYASDSNSCGQDLLRVGYEQGYAALVRFDLAPIPADATVTQATLQLYARGWGGTNMTINAYRVLRGTDLCQATWNQARNGQNWGLPGCNDTATDRSPMPEDSVVTSGVSQWYSFDLTGLVQDWLDGAPNHGALLRGGLPRSTAMFHLASARSSDPRLRPKLVITYRARQ